MTPSTSTHSPFRDGFAALRHEPALLAAELTWRWCFGLSAWGLAVTSVALFLDSIRISPRDELLLRTLQPRLLANALRHIFQGSLSRFLIEQAVLLLGVTLLWSLAATAGRAATLHRLVAMFRLDSDDKAQSTQWHFTPIFFLQLLRAMWSLIALAVAVGLLLYGTLILKNQHPLRAALALPLGFAAVCFIGILLSWFLAVAPLFCIRNGAGAMEAVEQAADFSERHAGRLFLLAVEFVALRLVWVGTMVLAFLSPLSLLGRIGAGWVMLLTAGAALMYFAVADLLYLARLAAYVSLAEDDSHRTLWEAASNSPGGVEPIAGLA
jgi:hypothetical protein